MHTLDYQPKNPTRRKWFSIWSIIAIGVSVTSLGASGWIYFSRPRAATAAAPAVQDGVATETILEEKPYRWKSYAELHDTILDRFASSEGFGNARIVNDLYWTYNSTIEVNGKLYAVGAVQLISLNDGDDPFVYVRDDGKSPSKKELKNFKHAPLDEMQADALKELQAGKDVVQTGSGDKLRLVGALRATTSCAKCHDVEEGTLMGAFNYPLVAMNSKP